MVLDKSSLKDDPGEPFNGLVKFSTSLSSTASVSIGQKVMVSIGLGFVVVSAE